MKCTCNQRLYGKAAEIYQSYAGKERSMMINQAIIFYHELSDKIDMLLENPSAQAHKKHLVAESQQKGGCIPKELKL